MKLNKLLTLMVILILILIIFSVGVKSEKDVCIIGLDCDQYCISKYNNDTKKASDALINIVKHAIYPFYDDRLNDINFQIGQIRMYPNQYFNGFNANNMLELYGQHLIQNKVSNCLNLLFSKIKDEHMQGIAYVDRLCNHYNVGIITLDANWAEIVVATAHEMGHILGASHTCETKSDDITKTCKYKDGDTCNPIGDNKYLMYPVILTCHQNNFRFSQCGIDTINQLYKKYTCLTHSDTILVPSYFKNDCIQYKQYIILSITIIISVSLVLIYYLVSVNKTN